MNGSVLRLVLGLFLVAGVATADVPPPAQTACSGKKIGEACNRRSGDSGIYQKATCSRSRPGPDSQIVTHTRDCTLCLSTADKRDDKAPEPPPEKKSVAGVSGPMSMGLGGVALVLGGFGAWAIRQSE